MVPLTMDLQPCLAQVDHRAAVVLEHMTRAVAVAEQACMAVEHQAQQEQLLILMLTMQA
jgi:hypothetical protein